MSNLNKYQCETPEQWHVKAQMAAQTLRQVEKDFALHGVPVLLNINDLEYSGIVNELAQILEENDFVHSPKMAAILYQIDLNERDLSANVEHINPANMYNFLADKILKRCFEKVYWRYKMSQE